MSASKHPAQGPSKPTRHQQPPVDGDEGFTGHIHEQKKRAFEERDQPDATKR
jgi:hypothetical protein